MGCCMAPVRILAWGVITPYARPDYTPPTLQFGRCIRCVCVRADGEVEGISRSFFGIALSSKTERCRPTHKTNTWRPKFSMLFNTFRLEIAQDRRARVRESPSGFGSVDRTWNVYRNRGIRSARPTKVFGSARTSIAEERIRHGFMRFVAAHSAQIRRPCPWITDGHRRHADEDKSP